MGILSSLEDGEEGTVAFVGRTVEIYRYMCKFDKDISVHSFVEG